MENFKMENKKADEYGVLKKFVETFNSPFSIFKLSIANMGF